MCRLGLTRKISKIALCAERKRKPSMFKLFVRPVFKAQAHDDTWYMEKKSTDLEVSFGSFCIARYSQSQFCQDITKRTGQSSFLARIWHFGHFIAFNSSLSRVTLSDQKCSQGKSNDVKWYNYQVIYQVYIYIYWTPEVFDASLCQFLAGDFQFSSFFNTWGISAAVQRSTCHGVVRAATEFGLYRSATRKI